MILHKPAPFLLETSKMWSRHGVWCVPPKADVNERTPNFHWIYWYWLTSRLLQMNYCCTHQTTTIKWRFFGLKISPNCPTGRAKTIDYQSCTLLSCRNLTLWSNIETTSKLWDLNYEAESPKKAGFLYYLDAPKLISCKEKGGGDAENKITWKGKGDTPR